MAWVRIHDAALSHPKLVGLIDWNNPFCVWVWGLSYCQTHLTNGVLPEAAVPNQKASRTAARLVAAGLWEARDGGWLVHDYLDWNESRETVLKKRNEARDRMSSARERSAQSVRANNSITSREVLRGVGSSNKPLEEIDDQISERAGRFVERFAELYAIHRHGARWLRRQPNLDWTRALTLCGAWDDARLEKLAVIFLTTDDEWIAKTDRGLAVFESKATWCDERLAAWEAQQRKPA